MRRARGRLDRGGAEEIAGLAFAALAAEPERLGAFLAATGLDPGAIRQAAAEPTFLPAVLDHVAADEALLVAIADAIGVSPETVDAARSVLSPEMAPDG